MSKFSNISIFNFLHICQFLAMFLIVSALLATGNVTSAYAADEISPKDKHFSQFAADMPDGWDGDEETGFISDNPDEYQLTFGYKNKYKSHYLAQVSIYLLPNNPGTDAREAAIRLAEAQADSTEPRQEGNFWVFEGEPRTPAIKGRGKTMVNATSKNLLIIIARDPDNIGADKIIDSLRGLTPVAKELLGR